MVTHADCINTTVSSFSLMSAMLEVSDLHHRAQAGSFYGAQLV